MTIRWRASAVLAVVYVVVAEIGLAAHLLEGTTIFIWPPTGLSLAALVVFGVGLWPGVSVGTFVVVLLFRQPPIAALWIAIADTVEVVLACWLLDRVFQFHPALARVRDVVALAVVATGTSLISAASGVTGLSLLGHLPHDQVERLLASWWWSHVSADLVIAPVILTWLTKTPRYGGSTRPNVGEVVALVLCVLVVDAALFTGVLRVWLPGSATPFYLLPLLLWAGLRFGPRGGATATFAVGSMAITSVTARIGPFSALADLETFVSITSAATLLLSAVASERVRAVQRRGAVQSAALDAVVSIDANNHIVEFNPAAEHLFGYCAAEVLDKTVLILIPERHQAAYTEALRADHGGAGELAGNRYQTWAVRADGVEIPVEISLASVSFDGEEIRTGFIRDRTSEHLARRERLHAHALLEDRVRERTAELTRINQELERREAMLRQAEEAAHLGSFELEVTTDRLTWSDELYRIFGRDRASFTPTLEAFIAAFHPDDRDRIHKTILSAIERVEPFVVDERIVRPDGTVRCLASTGKVYRNGGTVAARVAGCCQDVTDQRAAERARYQLVDIAESSEDAIIGLSVNGTIESWNPAAARIFGYDRSEVVGRPCTIMAGAERTDELMRRIRRAAAGEHLAHYELPHRRKDGSTFDASVTTSAIRDPQGTVIGLSKVVRDISAQKSFENQLKLSIDEKEVLLREIHHRVKNNLQVISSLLNLQVSTETSPQSRRSLLESQNRIQSMALVHQLLYQSNDLGRIDVTTYLRTLAARLLGTYHVGSDRIELTVEGPQLSLGIDRVIPCGLIINELVANAIEHAFPDERSGHIWVTVDREADIDVSLTVRDDGIGIADDLDIEDGQSFGLQLARTLTHQLEGTIIAWPMNGTVVRVTFPLAPKRVSYEELANSARQP